MEVVGTTLADGELARQCAEGDDDAWRTFVQRFQKKIWYVAFQFTGRSDEAEELTQEIFLHLLSVLSSFDRGGSLPGWVQRVARNYAIDHYRRRRRERSLVRDDEHAEELLLAARDTSGRTDPHTRLETKDLSEWLRGVLDRLPEELSQAVILRDLQDMTYDEMAELLGIPLGTVKSRINRGRIELGRRLHKRRGEWSASLGPGGQL